MLSAPLSPEKQPWHGQQTQTWTAPRFLRTSPRLVYINKHGLFQGTRKETVTDCTALDSVGKNSDSTHEREQIYLARNPGVIATLLWIGKYCVIVFPELSCGGYLTTRSVLIHCEWVCFVPVYVGVWSGCTLSPLLLCSQTTTVCMKSDSETLGW